ncbi:coniferyl alcohol acyltransferase-like isoform X2 [Gastrolobium bilobum]|uniref:coniferyl alcohol acyltransferase-like isoform X2 n=1 Tax=Gastrolobium bilobum TaxID=150636 RepID=UPI002AB018C8|nr:coniferyl alcohol acyltransferase-like isoform X2 [Gastrolobium bilobum]
MGVENGEFTVSVTKEEVVAAVLPIQEHWLPLSNLDLLLPPVDVGVFFCYKNPMFIFGSMVGSLKKGLAQALVSYYAFAGEVVPNTVGEPELLCNNRGVDFVEAVADVELKCLNFYNPDDTFEDKLVPKKKHGVLAVQATSLKCGGIVVACTFDHRIADAYSANMFLVSWAHMAQPTKPITISTTATTTFHHPCFRRSLLSPRRPASIHPSLHHMYVPISKLTPPPATTTATPLISRIYYVTAEQLRRMQSLADETSNDSAKYTKLESFSAFLWKMVARAASRDINGKRVIAKMGIVVDGRKRLGNSGGGDTGREAMMDCYFGNVLSIPFGGKPVEELVEKPLGWVADEVHEFLAVAATEEHFLGLIDWVETHRPVPGLARIYCGGADEGPAFVVSSGQRFPEEKVNFGWGKVVFASYHFPWGGEAGYVMPMPSPLGNGDWVVYMHLEKGQLEIIESEAAHVFRPLTWDYLNQ